MATKKPAAKPTAVDTDKLETLSGTEAMLVVQLSIRRLGTRRRGDLESIETDAEKDLLHLSKELLECKELLAIRAHDVETLRGIKTRTLPSLFRTGIYTTKPSAVDAIDEYLKARREGRRLLVEDFARVYEAQREKDRERLQSQFNARDYPAVDALAEHFRIGWRYFRLGAPTEIAETSPDIFRRETQRIASLVDETRNEGLRALREGFAQLVAHMVAKLKPDADGSRKRFFGSNVTNLLDFIESFDVRNIANDTELKAVMDKVKKLLKGVDPAEVRKDETLRDRIAADFESVQKAVDTLVQKAPARRLDLDDF